MFLFWSPSSKLFTISSQHACMQDIVRFFLLFFFSSLFRQQIFASSVLFWIIQRVFAFVTQLSLAIFSGAHIINPLDRNVGSFSVDRKHEKLWKQVGKQIKKGRLNEESNSAKFMTGFMQYAVVQHRSDWGWFRPLCQWLIATLTFYTRRHAHARTSTRLVKQLERKQFHHPSVNYQTATRLNYAWFPFGENLRILLYNGLSFCLI